MNNPTTKDVARYLRARTRTEYGTEVGDFTDDTTPTGVQVIDLIQDAVDEITESVGGDIPPDLQSAALRLMTLLAAANVEMSYFPEQAAANNSMYDKLMDRVKSLRTALETDVSEEDIENEEGPDPTFDFPSPIGWDGVQW